MSQAGDFSSPASRVLRHLRRSSPASRERLAELTGLSPATVARAVNELLLLRLVRERHELAETSGRGRPRVPLELADDRFVCVGVHLGKRAATLAVSDLNTHLLAREVVPQPPTPAMLAELPGRIGQLLNRCLDRIPLAAAVTGPWEHLDVAPADVADDLTEALGLPVFEGSHIGAMAAVEFIRRGYRARERTLYVYMRNVAGAVSMVESDSRIDSSQPLDLTHLPTSSAARCDCGRRGCLEAAAGEHNVALRAVAEGIVTLPDIRLVYAAARAQDTAATRLLEERATILGEAMAVLRDLTRPVHLVALGQAFGGFPETLPTLHAAYAAHAGPARTELEVSTVGDELQAAAACATALGGVFADPRRVVPAHD